MARALPSDEPLALLTEGGAGLIWVTVNESPSGYGLRRPSNDATSE
jgi:hypothetical protein